MIKQNIISCCWPRRSPYHNASKLLTIALLAVNAIWIVPQVSKPDRIPENYKFSFPTVDERIKYYMGSWFNRSIINTEINCSEFPFYTSGMRWHDQAYLFNATNLMVAQTDGFLDLTKGNFLEYHNHVLLYYLPKSPITGYRMITTFGDSSGNPNFPLVSKARHAQGQVSQNSNDNRNDPILAYYQTDRHFSEPLGKLKKMSIPWHEKKNQLIWRGAPTGQERRLNVVKMFQNSNKTDIDIAFDLRNHRMAQMFQPPISKDLFAERIKIPQQLQYKYLLSLEGNDVATGLKWMLYSNSVVLMPTPTVVSWAMEDQLVPFYHYIPLHQNATNLETMLQWARQHDEECQVIARQATQFMQDLWMSEKAQHDNEIILTKMVTSYHNQFGDALAQCPPPM
mmetsp:Transcript_7250/g.9454  ORF Transcript_7250/g.9454 Transcript_7250/m.9454 type:complete len:396 (+) Transcript_7250:124-1311(+)|eukprot:CAMPEP_0198152742 /NCGR_PEP_ID=MMETSP1443-20131203/61145_1 /TAXON_ID=186043 /ORGANISM="Entomoneis sp., Strain CCMP2396" /LENGTH=395 /DNA_ID=CAMNT_0043818857 /DNA_START=117 /DNA_END=1304 /DNA_ORIENTATION=+